jgi:hypothetical protein
MFPVGIRAAAAISGLLRVQASRAYLRHPAPQPISRVGSLGCCGPGGGEDELDQTARGQLRSSSPRS